MLQEIQIVATTFSSYAWGPWLLVLLLGGGLFFLVYSRFAPFRHLRHALELIAGRHDGTSAPGQISHFQALSAALAGTVGMGNIAGVALAIYIGGPGAIFWMWMTAVVGMATKFFTCSLAVMYRGKDSEGVLQGGPMYVIREALGPRWRFLAYLFAGCGLIGALPAFQANQLVQILRDVVFIENGWMAAGGSHLSFNVGAGLLLSLISAIVILGGLQRIAAVASKLVPFMAALYMMTALTAVCMHLDQVPAMLALIVSDAFTGDAAAGGALLTVMLYGVQRGAYSNEAGIGTEALAHGAARTSEPIREGLVAMLGPVIDTLLVCTATALMILVSGVWRSGDANGVTLTAAAFQHLLGTPGLVVVFICVLCFATTTIFTYSFYGTQCASFIWGVRRARRYVVVYLAFIVVASIVTPQTAISIIDGVFALMAIPTMISTLLLAPRVKTAAETYFATLTEQ
ncbi:MAG: alanine/glycine:cation symporter family protein [Pseudomonadales bacterium]|jgi:AGCS family alanine or glycine:cation symporter|nr:alanine/glycine:cation symporter family protein [Pseudomonadales bacterium]MDP6471396.1 alanine/glycine:cation symporter family protein [Pseudomonadales bacterium]MDP6826412.1 alanine/glycine:cation symporter family protein [Pseudomonadales bacterium]MDP6970965.1 alanine/glycine:cation symporter family protein [Pseudomonadales bacterium]|tara:strand:+ start:125 stop:1498 length:1374 start_codon:yes stop_codon:yes gene_type:complete